VIPAAVAGVLLRPGMPAAEAGEAQTGMGRTEIVDATNQRHSMPQCQCPPTTWQCRQALPERNIKPLDVGRVTHPRPGEYRPSVSTCAGGPSNNTALNVDHLAVTQP